MRWFLVILLALVLFSALRPWLEKLGLGGFLARRERDAGWTVLFLSAEDPPRILQRVAVEASQPRPKVLDTPAPLPLSSEDAPLLHQPRAADWARSKRSVTSATVQGSPRAFSRAKARPPVQSQ